MFIRYSLYFTGFFFKFCIYLCLLNRSFAFFTSVISALTSPLYFSPLDPIFEWRCVRTQQNLLQSFISKTERQCVQMNLQQVCGIWSCQKWVILCNSRKGWCGGMEYPNFFNCLNCSIINKILQVAPNVMTFIKTDKICHQFTKRRSYDATKTVFYLHLSENTTEKHKQ